MEEMVGPVSKCRRKLLQGWWRPLSPMVSFMICTESVRNILDTPSYSKFTYLYGYLFVLFFVVMDLFRI
jgi:hypothetical protein